MGAAQTKSNVETWIEKQRRGCSSGWMQMPEACAEVPNLAGTRRVEAATARAMDPSRRLTPRGPPHRLGWSSCLQGRPWTPPPCPSRCGSSSPGTPRLQPRACIRSPSRPPSAPAFLPPSRSGCGCGRTPRGARQRWSRPSRSGGPQLLRGGQGTRVPRLAPHRSRPLRQEPGIRISRGVAAWPARQG